MSKKPPRIFLRARRWADSSHFTLWLIRADGPAEATLLWGEVIPAVLEEIRAASALEVVEEQHPLPAEPMGVPGCQTVAQQKTLFGDSP